MRQNKRNNRLSLYQSAQCIFVIVLGQIPLVQTICECSDNGEPVALRPETPDGQAFLRLAAALAYHTERRNDEQEPTKIVETHG